MNLTVVSASEVQFAEAETCLVVPAYEGEFPFNSSVLKSEQELVLQALVDKGVFSGRAQECYYLPSPDAPYQGVLALGMGKRETCSTETVRRAGGKACSFFDANRVVELVLDVSHFPDVPVHAFLEGVLLGQYRFDLYKADKDDPKKSPKVSNLQIVASEKADRETLEGQCKQSVLACLSANGARHLANTPPNDMTPTALAEFAKGIANDTGCEVDILDVKQMASLGMNALLGVAKGSTQVPKLIVLRHHHADNAPTIAMVGKGVTFDTGGISLKPGEAMHEMKFDMCGAAAVLCAFMGLAEVKPALNLLCVVPAVENKPDAEAMVPGDIVKAYNGKTIEVHNTDAEGRLILADALAYTVDKYKPDVIIDLATLTGACVVALGHYAAGLFTNDDDLSEALTLAGEVTGENVWRLPLNADYEKLIEGTHADICNIGPRGEAGSITAAAFLKHFVGETKWAHLDIAGTAWGGKHIPYWDSKHATGFGVRLLTEFVLQQADDSE